MGEGKLGGGGRGIPVPQGGAWEGFKRGLITGAYRGGFQVTHPSPGFLAKQAPLHSSGKARNFLCFGSPVVEWEPRDKLPFLSGILHSTLEANEILLGFCPLLGIPVFVFFSLSMASASGNELPTLSGES